MGDKETGAVAVDAPLLILRIRVNTTAKLLAERLQARRMIRGWGDSNSFYELSLITPSEDPLGHTALLYTGHTDHHNGTTYPAAIWYALDDLRLSPARVLLTISARLHSQTVLDYVYDVLKMLRARYLTLSVELAETNSFVDRNEALPLDYGFEITPVISLGKQPIEPAHTPPPRRRSSGHGVGTPDQPAAAKTERQAAELYLQSHGDSAKVIEMSSRKIPIWQIAGDTPYSAATIKRIRQAARITGQLKT